MSTLLELAGFTALTAAAYEWSGRAMGLLVLGCALFVIALGVEGIHPLRAARVAVLRRWQTFRARRDARQRARGERAAASTQS